MKKFLLARKLKSLSFTASSYLLVTTISILILSVLFSVQAQDGFVIYSDNGGCDRALKYMPIKNGEFGEEQVAVEKGESADIWVVISGDGVWIAFSRASKRWSNRFGGCDYHTTGNYDIYIAKIDNGKTLPAKAIKVAHGFNPSWGVDAKFPNKDKTLYYSDKGSSSIMKAMIKPDGTFSPPEKHCGAAGKMMHTQAAPNGKYYAYYTGNLAVNTAEGQRVAKAGGGGCHPSWGPRGNYLCWAQKNVCKVEDGKTTMEGKNNGLGKYWYGISNDDYWEEGKLWAIGRLFPEHPGPGQKFVPGQNGHGILGLIEVDISGGGWNPGQPKKLPKFGSSCDVHIFGPDGPPEATGTLQKVNQKLGKGINYSTQITRGVSGLQLVIESQELTSGYNAALYDLRGKQKVFMKMSGSLKNVLPLNGLAEGRYILKLSNNEITVQKPVLISR